MIPAEEWRAREELVGDAWKFLRECEEGERPDASPEVVELARAIVEHGGQTSGAPMPMELRQRVRQIRREGLEWPHPPAVKERLQEILDELHKIQGEADALVDHAAEKLAELVTEHSI